MIVLQVEPAVIKCLVRLTNRVKAIALSDVNDQVFGDEAKVPCCSRNLPLVSYNKLVLWQVVAGSQFPALVVRPVFRPASLIQ